MVAMLAADTHGCSLHAPGEKASHQMRNRSCIGAVTIIAILLLAPLSQAQDQAATAPSTSDAVAKHLDELEQQLKELRAEVAALKGTEKAAPAPAATENAVSAPAAAAPATPPAAPSLAGLLGPTTLSGFVDTY